ncbi:Polypeptide N-acetylgalactosaminyltransferase-like 6 [Liparis tanakae]|uniref:Polypeptide N-acetylgalactosaminyltransferase-like 6 n=1 Tax=Liparis tanakae TaxID=230148 RepID=A0A4Z2FJ35_9TELE|nr:Polypeptide N-acetylgalactosaminyltransferase-like 6 [Liparis tanakae]
MRRRQKRLLQVCALLGAALLFLPNVGLWSLYRDRDRDRGPDSAPADGPAAAVQVRSSVWCSGSGVPGLVVFRVWGGVPGLRGLGGCSGSGVPGLGGSGGSGGVLLSGPR